MGDNNLSYFSRMDSNNTTSICNKLSNVSDRVPTKMSGRVPFDQNSRKFRLKINWNRKIQETHFENFGLSLRVVRFSGDLEIRKFSVTFDISTLYESAPVPLVAPERYKITAS